MSNAPKFSRPVQTGSQYIARNKQAPYRGYKPWSLIKKILVGLPLSFLALILVVFVVSADARFFGRTLYEAFEVFRYKEAVMAGLEKNCVAFPKYRWGACYLEQLRKEERLGSGTITRDMLTSAVFVTVVMKAKQEAKTEAEKLEAALDLMEYLNLSVATLLPSIPDFSLASLRAQQEKSAFSEAGAKTQVLYGGIKIWAKTAKGLEETFQKEGLTLPIEVQQRKEQIFAERERLVARIPDYSEELPKLLETKQRTPAANKEASANTPTGS